ncbi:MAG: hypothetical protein R3A79_12445 [Nannocystaceae bacterium]
MQVDRIIMVTPFDSGIAALEHDDQLVLLKGCVLCQITRDLDRGSTRNKPEWRACKAEIGAPIEIFTVDRAAPRVLAAIDDDAPAVLAEVGGALHLLLDRAALARCKGSVADFRGRLSFRASTLGLELGL